REQDRYQRRADRILKAKDNQLKRIEERQHHMQPTQRMAGEKEAGAQVASDREPAEGRQSAKPWADQHTDQAAAQETYWTPERKALLEEIKARDAAEREEAERDDYER